MRQVALVLMMVGNWMASFEATSLGESRMLDTVDTINSILDDVEIKVDIPAGKLTCDRISIGNMDFLAEIDANTGTELQKQEVKVDIGGIKAKCTARVAVVPISVDSRDTKVFLPLDFYSEEVGKVLPTVVAIPDDFECAEDFLDLDLKGLVGGIAGSIAGEIVCPIVEPLLESITDLLSNNIFTDFINNGPEPVTDILEAYPVKEEILRQNLPQGFSFYDEEQFDATLSGLLLRISSSPFAQVIESEFQIVIEAYHSDDAALLAAAISEFILAVAEVEFEFPVSAAEAILEIDFGSGDFERILEVIQEAFGDVSIIGLISKIITALGPELKIPTSEEFLQVLDALNLPPAVMGVINQLDLIEMVVEFLDVFHTPEMEKVMKIAYYKITREDIEKFTVGFKAYFEKYTLDTPIEMIQRDLFYRPLHELFQLLPTSVAQEIKLLLEPFKFHNLAQILNSITNGEEKQELTQTVFNILNILPNTERMFSLVSVLSERNGNDGLFTITIPLEGFGELTLTLLDVGAEADLSVDKTDAGFKTQSSLILPLLNLENAVLSGQVNFKLIDTSGREPKVVLEDTLSLAGSLAAFTHLVFTFAFNYEALNNYNFDLMTDISSALYVMLDLAGCAIASTGFALNSQKTFIDLGFNFDSEEAFDGFLEDAINTIATLYTPIVDTVVQLILAIVQEVPEFVVINGLSTSCVRQGSIDGFKRNGEEATPQEASDDNGNPSEFIGLFGLIGFTVIGALVAYYIRKNKDLTSSDAETKEEIEVSPTL